MSYSETISSQTQTDTPTPPRILVVDDEIELERLIKQRFRKKIQSKKLDFVFVHNGLEAVKHLREKNHIDIVLTDINMPEMDGLTLLELLPEIDGDLRAVVISAYSDLRNIRAAMNRGAFDFLVKPIDFQDLEITIEKTSKHIQSNKETKKKLKKAEEQDVLLREIHHRVKNNLHVVANLLDLQSDFIKDEKVLELFADSQSRIQSMALIHEQLYQSDNLRQLNFGEYLHNLVQNILSCNERGNNVEIAIDTQDLWLNLETAIPCGLLINELVTNIFKHAFPKGYHGRIEIQISQDEKEIIYLKVGDNGVGLPPEIDWKQSPSLGLKLVRILSKQLKASITLDTQLGTLFTLTFKPLNYQPQLGEEG
jgi:two-component sensor histidine kinase